MWFGNYNSGALARRGAPWVRKYGKLPIRENLVITWPYTDRPPHHRHTNVKFRVVCAGGFLARKRMATRALWSMNNLEVQRSQLRTKTNFSYRLTFFIHPYFVHYLFIMPSSLEYRDRERGRENEKLGGKQTKLNERERERERERESAAES